MRTSRLIFSFYIIIYYIYIYKKKKFTLSPRFRFRLRWWCLTLPPPLSLFDCPLKSPSIEREWEGGRIYFGWGGRKSARARSSPFLAKLREACQFSFKYMYTYIWEIKDNPLQCNLPHTFSQCSYIEEGLIVNEDEGGKARVGEGGSKASEGPVNFFQIYVYIYLRNKKEGSGTQLAVKRKAKKV